MIHFKKIESDDELLFLNEVRNGAVKFLHNDTPYSIEETKQWYSTLEVPYYIVFLGEIKIGYFRLSNYSKQNRNMYIGMDLGENYRGKGLAFESYVMFIPYVFELYGLNKLSLEVLSTNQPAYNLYKKLGFVEEGVKRQEIYRDGNYLDSIVMSMLKSEMLMSSIYTQG